MSDQEYVHGLEKQVVDARKRQELTEDRIGRLEDKCKRDQTELIDWRVFQRQCAEKAEAKLVALREALEEKVCHQFGGMAYQCDLCGSSSDDSEPIDHATDCVLADAPPE